MEQKTIDCQGKKLSFRHQGQGPAVVLLHGFGEDGSVWARQYPAFKGKRLLIPDLPGSGGSELGEDLSMEGLAASLRNFLDQLHIPACTLIGHSMGGYVALAFAEKYPDRLNGLGLFHSTAYADSEEKKQARRKGITFIHEHGPFEFLKTSIPNLYSPVTRDERPGLVQEQITAASGFTATALAGYYEGMIARPDRTAVLRETSLPVLFVLGRHDVAVPLKDGLEQCHIPAWAQVCLLERSGHMGMQEEPEKANASLMAYVYLNKYNIQVDGRKAIEP